MLRIILSLVIGLALVAFGLYELRSWDALPLNRVPIVETSLVMGLVIALFATLCLVFPRRRRTMGGFSGSNLGSYGDSGSSHGGDCGHGGGDGGGCGDGGGGH